VTTLILDNVDSSTPQTHVLAIGVDKYTYLKNGSKSGQGISVHMGLEQLTAPGRSATALAEFFESKTTYNNPDAPIGSIAVLLSSGQYTSAHTSTPKTVDKPTFLKIKTYTKEWAQRLDADRNNVGVFYFCGHGIEPARLLLLPQNFGKDPLDPWKLAINFTATYGHLAQFNARTQIFLVDACRAAPTDANDAALQEARNNNVLGQALVGSIPGRVVQQRAAPRILAAALDQKAFAPAGGADISYFAKAVIKCLTRGGAERFNGHEWVVTTDSIGRNLKDRLQRVQLPKGASAACENSGASNFTVDLNRFSGKAQVLYRVTVDPAMEESRVSVVLHDSAASSHNHPPPGPWEGELETDDASSWQLDVSHVLFSKGKTIRGLKPHPPIFTPVVQWP